MEAGATVGVGDLQWEWDLEADLAMVGAFTAIALQVYNFQRVSFVPHVKVEKILKGSLDSIPSPSVKIQTIGGKNCLRCKCKILMRVFNKLLKTKTLLTSPSNVLPTYFK